jgi:disulfide bond formation protein DsbB
VSQTSLASSIWCWSDDPLGLCRSLPLALVVLALVFAGSTIFGTYHASVEWGFWRGPSDCTGTFGKSESMTEFLQQLQAIKVVRCDAVTIRILGLSLAGWNAVISAARHDAQEG